ncbi:hypothetical protein ACQPZP_10125 [Spirillospora sp. CA-142024]|uniref:hypothetical protein n=1 Tax=Spirillospora sp. CA-142024 TaxID=3240036 RepID=UPI003D94D197
MADTPGPAGSDGGQGSTEDEVKAAIDTQGRVGVDLGNGIVVTSSGPGVKAASLGDDDS